MVVVVAEWLKQWTWNPIRVSLGRFESCQQWCLLLRQTWAQMSVILRAGDCPFISDTTHTPLVVRTLGLFNLIIYLMRGETFSGSQKQVQLPQLNLPHEKVQIRCFSHSLQHTRLEILWGLPAQKLWVNSFTLTIETHHLYFKYFFIVSGREPSELPPTTLDFWKWPRWWWYLLSVFVPLNGREGDSFYPALQADLLCDCGWNVPDWAGTCDGWGNCSTQSDRVNSKQSQGRFSRFVKCEIFLFEGSLD